MCWQSNFDKCRVLLPDPFPVHAGVAAEANPFITAALCGRLTRALSARVLLASDSGCADKARIAPQRGEIDRRAFCQHGERPAPHFVAHGGEEFSAKRRLVAAEGHGAPQHHAVGIDSMHQVYDADAQQAGRVEYQLQCQGVSGLGLACQDERRQLFPAGDLRRKRACAAGGQGFLRVAG